MNSSDKLAIMHNALAQNPNVKVKVKIKIKPRGKSDGKRGSLEKDS